MRTSQQAGPWAGCGGMPSGSPVLLHAEVLRETAMVGVGNPTTTATRRRVRGAVGVRAGRDGGCVWVVADPVTALERPSSASWSRAGGRRTTRPGRGAGRREGCLSRRPRLAGRHGRFLRGNAIDPVDEACSTLHAQTNPQPEEVDTLERRKTGSVMNRLRCSVRSRKASSSRRSSGVWFQFFELRKVRRPPFRRDRGVSCELTVGGQKSTLFWFSFVSRNGQMAFGREFRGKRAAAICPESRRRRV